MAQTKRDSGLQRTERLKAKVGARLYSRINSGVALVYRRGKGGRFGTWSAKITVSPTRNHRTPYQLERLGDADDFQDANGVDVLSYAQAQELAIKRAEAAKVKAGRIVGTDTVADAGSRYLDWFRKHRKSARETETAYRTHVLPSLGSKRLAELRSATIRHWHESLASSPARVRTSRFAAVHNSKGEAVTAEDRRARQASANRVLTILKAILNRAYQDGRVSDDSEWRRVRPFKGVDQARIRFLTDSEAQRLVNACPPDLRRLVSGALLTGARCGELCQLQVQDVDLRTGHVYIASSKSGRPRSIPLNPEGLALFREAVTGKVGEDRVFLRSDGRAWGVNHHVRPLAAACAASKVKPAIAFHELRHTYASHLAQAGVDLLTISKLLGHADTRITARHYAHLTDKTLAAAVTKLPSFTNHKESLVSVARKRRAA